MAAISHPPRSSNSVCIKETWASNEALKQYALEHHSVREMLNIIKSE